MAGPEHKSNGKSVKRLMARRTVVSVLFALAQCALGGIVAARQGGRIESADLDGFVRSTDGRPLPENVMVGLCDTGGVLIQQSAVASGGKFSFGGLREGEYILKVTAEDFESQEVRVNMRFGNVHGTMIYLKPIAAEAAATAKSGAISSHELSMPEAAREQLRAGRAKLYRENKPQEALKDFIEAQKKAPGFYEINYEMGMAYLNLGQKAKAGECFSEAIAMSKDSYADAQIGLGTLLVDQGNLNEGEQHIERGIQLNATRWMGYYQLARTKVIRGDLQGAEADAEHARSLAPKAAMTYQLLSTIHLRQKNYAKLLQDIDSYLELDADSAAAQRAREVREQVVRTMSEGAGGELGEVTVAFGVRDARGMPLEESARVRLKSKFGGVDRVAATNESSEVSFSNVLKGAYEVTVECPGYRTMQGNLDVTEEQSFFRSYVYLQGMTEPGSPEAQTKRSSLPAKTMREIDEGLADLRKKSYGGAQKHFAAAVELSPTDPEVFYLRGKAEVGLRQGEAAKKDFEQALTMDPSHEKARLSLGELQLQNGDAAGAIATLNEAYTNHGANWRTHYVLAEAYAKTGEWQKSEEHAQRAVNLAQGNGAGALLLLGDAEAALGDRAGARESWKRVVADYPTAAEAAEAKRELMAGAEPSTLRGERGKTAESVEDASWAPPDIDGKDYALAPGVSCTAEDILPRAWRRTQSQLENLEKFTATEQVEHQEFDRQGQAGAIKSRSFSYVVYVRGSQDGTKYLEELRDGGLDLEAFPTPLVTVGLNSIAFLLVQPEYRTEYTYTCRGLTNVRGEAAWEVRFEEKRDAQRHVRRWKRKEVSYDIPVKGLLWFGASSYDVLRVETDLREPIDALQLSRDHVIVNYGPVRFNDGESTLWLPWTAETYLELHGKRYHHKHSLTDYILFNVDSSWKAKAPKEE